MKHRIKVQKFGSYTFVTVNNHVFFPLTNRLFCHNIDLQLPAKAHPKFIEWMVERHMSRYQKVYESASQFMENFYKNPPENLYYIKDIKI